MHPVIEKLRAQAQSNPQTIVLPEAGDERTQKAAAYLEKEKIAIPLLLTKGRMDPRKQDEFAGIYYERKKARGMSLETARELMKDPLYYATMLVRYGGAGGFVSGAVATSAAVVKAAIGCFELDRTIGIITSCFLMTVPDTRYGEQGALIYADCGVIPVPTEEQLAGIAVAAGKFARDILGFNSRVALLSFSTKGSAQGPWVDRIKKASDIAKTKTSEFSIDGEMQADAALVPEIARRKLSGSAVAGNANVLIFPNLEAGNICYKLTERLANGRALGPIILGTVQPASDLSRGCSVEDIIDCAAITAVRAQKRARTTCSSGT